MIERAREPTCWSVAGRRVRRVNRRDPVFPLDQAAEALPQSSRPRPGKIVLQSN